MWSHRILNIAIRGTARRAGDSPQPAPEDDPYEHDDRVQRQPSPDDRGRDEVPLGEVDREVESRRYERATQLLEREEETIAITASVTRDPRYGT